MQLPDQRPVVQVSWQQAIEFGRRLAAITGDASLLLDGDEAPTECAGLPPMGSTLWARLPNKPNRGVLLLIGLPRSASILISPTTPAAPDPTP